MITLVFGAAGTGKTAYVLDRVASDVAAKRRSFLVVPEHNTVSVEAAAARRLPPDAPLLFEVTNFTRLSDTFFRRLGGVATRYADESTAALLLRDTLVSLSPLLHDRRRIDTARVCEMLSAVRELRAAGIGAEALAAAAEKTADAPTLSHKLSDLALLLSGYGETLAAHESRLPGDDLSRLAALLRAHPPKDECFCFDGFTSFTAVQLDILGALMPTAELIITLPMPEENRKGSLAYAEVERTATELRRLARRTGASLETVSLSENHRAGSRVLAEVGERLFTTSPRPIEAPAATEGEAIRIFECRTPFSEAELVASDIARRVQNGASYRDFAIVARSATDYRGVLDTALERHGIPAFFSLPTDMTAYEATKLIRTAYAVITGGGRREDVITYTKCGLLGISPDDCDRFELYTELWQLRGDQLLRHPFRMPPGGYQPPRSEEERAVASAALDELNRIQRTIAEPLTILAQVSKGDFTIKEHCETLFAFLTRLEVDRRLYERARELAADGDPARADEYARLFGVITGILDRLVELLPDSKLSAEDFSDLLTLLFSSQSLGTIPTRADAVTVGSADLLRPNEPRHVYLIGVNADVFPRGGEQTGIFSQAELARLGDCGILLDGDEVVRTSREWFCFLRAFLAASESVTLSYYLSDFSFTPAARSETLDRILAITGDSFPIRREEELPLLDRIRSRDAALAALGGDLTAAEHEAILLALSPDPEAAERIRIAGSRLVDPGVRVGSETMDAIYGKRMSLTQSRIEKYVGCPFSYFCQYILKLSENRRAAVRSADIGSYIHAIMEHFFGGERVPDEDIPRHVEALTREYLATLFPEGTEPTPRVMHRFSRLGALAVRIVRELCEEADASAFAPIFFEYEPLAGDEERAAPPVLTLEDGTEVTLYGKIDRVDIYRKDGDAYLRVIDYKTGTKKFSLDDIARGKNLQMLIYLFALWKTDRPAFLRRLGVGEGGRILPAGALYVNLSLATATVDSPEMTGGELCSRSGLLLRDADSLRAMDPLGEGRFIPLSLNEDGTPKKGALENLCDLEEMGRLMTEVDKAVGSIAGRLRGGCADAVPGAVGEGRGTACDFCPYYPVCRNLGGVHAPGEEES